MRHIHAVQPLTSFSRLYFDPFEEFNSEQELHQFLDMYRDAFWQQDNAMRYEGNVLYVDCKMPAVQQMAVFEDLNSFLVKTGNPLAIALMGLPVPRLVAKRSAG